ncbi:MAG TPA: hypothetical protein VJS44_12115 [Pyrinomonadaceae bacterium]|nr:hypothetical protein [Pyrinomonadaceae bacterium]
MSRIRFAAALLFIITLSVLSVSTRNLMSPHTYAYAGLAKPSSLCAPDEQVVWSCETVKERKLASICGSKDLSGARGYVQYRFGRAGRVELEFPRERTGTQSAFKYSRYTRPLVTYLKLEFVNGGVSYSISDDSNDEEKPARRDASITVKTADAKETTLRCRMPVAGSLMKLEDVVERED